MELVYLWVEDYKNIKKQGFNFSPRFNCSYDEHTHELTIDENKEYVNIFPENINITAIIGENGSGKSNVLEALICIIEKNSDLWNNYKICAIFFDKENNFFPTKEINYQISVKNNIDDLRNISPRKYNTFLFHYNYTLDYIENEENNINFNKLYHKSNGYEKPILLQPNKTDRKIDAWLMDYLANKDILNFIIKKKKSIKNIENFFIPTFCKLDFSFSYIYNKKSDTIYKILEEKYKSENILYLTEISQLTKDDLIYLTKVYIIKKNH